MKLQDIRSLLWAGLPSSVTTHIETVEADFLHTTYVAAAESLIVCYRTIRFSSAISTANSANSSRNKDWAGGSCWAGKRGVELQERRKDTFQDRFLSFTFSTQLGSLLIASFWLKPPCSSTAAQASHGKAKQEEEQGGKETYKVGNVKYGSVCMLRACCLLDVWGLHHAPGRCSSAVAQLCPDATPWMPSEYHGQVDFESRGAMCVCLSSDPAFRHLHFH